MRRAGLVDVRFGTRLAFGLVLDEFDPRAIGVEVGEGSRRPLDVDGLRERLPGDAEPVERLESEHVPVELDGAFEIGYGHTEVVCPRARHTGRRERHRKTRFASPGRAPAAEPSSSRLRSAPIGTSPLEPPGFGAEGRS